MSGQPTLDLQCPLVASPFFKTILKGLSITEKERGYLEHFRKYGCIIVEDCIVDKITADAIRNDCESIALGYGDNRIQDAWKTSSVFRSVALNPHLLSIIRVLYGREPIPVQTLNFLQGSLIWSSNFRRQSYHRFSNHPKIAGDPRVLRSNNSLDANVF